MSDDGMRERLYTNPYAEERRSPLRYIGYALSAGFIALVAGFVFVAFLGGSLGPTFDGYASVALSKLNLSLGEPDLGAVYVKLGLKPPQYLSSDARRNLALLDREPCDNQAIYGLAEDVAKVDIRWAADAYSAFSDRCGPMAEGDLRRAGDLYLLVGEYNLALAAENRALSIFDADSEALYKRGKAYIGLARYEDAAKDIRRAINMIGTEHTTLSIHWDLAHALKSAGHVCDAADALDELIRTHPSGAAQARPIADEYRQECQTGSGSNDAGLSRRQADDLAKALSGGH